MCWPRRKDGYQVVFLAGRSRPRLHRQCVSSRNSAGRYRERQAAVRRARAVHGGAQGQTGSPLRPHADQARSGSAKEIAAVKTRVENRLGQIRKAEAWASDLARRVSWQTIYAIEAGTYVPNTEVALNLARELEVTIDELFSLHEGSHQSPESLAAEVLSAEAPAKGQPVRICQIGARWVSVPVSATPYYMPEADGIIKKTGCTSRRATGRVRERRGCAETAGAGGVRPGYRLLSSMVEKISGVEVVSAAASSKLGAHLAQRRQSSYCRLASGRHPKATAPARM